MVRPSASCALELAEPSEITADLGTTWGDGLVGGSPFEYMLRPAIVLKADDLHGALSEEAAHFVATDDDLGAIPSIGIIAGELFSVDAVLGTYGDLADAGIELPFYGHEHIYLRPGKTISDLHGAGREAQSQAFRTGLEVGRKKLGVTFDTFGAPGNDADHDTGTAGSEYPSVVVGLSGREGQGYLVLSRLMDIAEDASRVSEPATASAKLEAVASEETATSEHHLKDWASDPDLLYVEGFLTAPCDLDVFRCSTSCGS